VEDDEDELLQTKAVSGRAPELTPDMAATIASMQGDGKPLPASERGFFESRFGHDFGQVRIHTGPKAAETARAVQARAYTVGSDIVFGANQIALPAAERRLLLAHELTHVVQQAGTSSPCHPIVQTAPGNGSETPSEDNAFQNRTLQLARRSNIVRSLEEKANGFGFEFGGLISGQNSYTDLDDKKIYIRGDRSLEDAVLDYAHELQNAANQESINAVYDKFEGGDPSDASAFADAILELDIEGLITKAEVARELGLEILNIEDTFILAAQRLADKFRTGKISEEKYRNKLRKIVEKTATVDGLSPREHYIQHHLGTPSVQRTSDDHCTDVIDDPFLGNPDVAAAIDEAWKKSKRNEPYSRRILDAFNARRTEEMNQCLKDENKTMKDCEGDTPEEHRAEYRGRRFREVGFYVDAAGNLSGFHVAELPWLVSIPNSPEAAAIFHTHPPKQTIQVAGNSLQVSPEDTSALSRFRGRNKRFYVIERDRIDLIALQSDRLREAQIIHSWSRRDVRKCAGR